MSKIIIFSFNSAEIIRFLKEHFGVLALSKDIFGRTTGSGRIKPSQNLSASIGKRIPLAPFYPVRESRRFQSTAIS